VTDIQKQIDRLYQVPPGEFTAARTELARSFKGPEAAQIKQLKKPAVVPWAVNQVYWQARPIYQRTLQSGQALRAAQVAALEGRTADVREATKAHRQAISEAVQRAVQLAGEAGITPNTEPLTRMFEALSLATTPPPHPGRFTEVLQPVAFEVFAGVTPVERTPPAAVHKAEKPARTPVRDLIAERKREQAVRAERLRLEAELKAATDVLSRAREAEGRARQALVRASADVREAEEAVEAARARRDDGPR
jgi:hypothetical protein